MRRTSLLLGVLSLLSLGAGPATTGHEARGYPISVAPAAPSGNAFDVYFRHDAVGRAQLALVATTCGTERWTVKTAADDDRQRINRTPRDASIRYLRNRPAPATRPESARVAPVEITTYRVHARLVEYVREADSDYHLVLADPSGRTMIAEIPAPACVARISPLRSAIQTARRSMNAHFAVGTSFRRTDVSVVVRGVGFFDFPHGQTGMAPNSIELHPVTGISFS